MKVTYKSKSGRLLFELDGSTTKEIFKAVGAVQEVFDEGVCGKCGGQDVRFVVRTVEENDYHELRCTNKDCRAKLSFGAHKKGGGLFPKRKGDDDKWLANNGWEVWDGTKVKKE